MSPLPVTTPRRQRFHAIRILLHLGEDGPDMSLTQVASALRRNESTAHGLLRPAKSSACEDKD
jgi:hypothetical protein